MTAEGDDLLTQLQEVLAAIERNDVDPADVAERLKVILDALPPGPGAVDTPMRRKVAEIADGLDTSGPQAGRV